MPGVRQRQWINRRVKLAKVGRQPFGRERLPAPADQNEREATKLLRWVPVSEHQRVTGDRLDRRRLQRHLPCGGILRGSEKRNLARNVVLVHSDNHRGNAGLPREPVMDRMEFAGHLRPTHRPGKRLRVRNARDPEDHVVTERRVDDEQPADDSACRQPHGGTESKPAQRIRPHDRPTEQRQDSEPDGPSPVEPR